MTTATYDRKEIMQAAWEIVRKADRARFPLRMLLRTAWMKARRAIAAARAVPVEQMSAAQRELTNIENKRRQTSEDMARMVELRAEIEADYAEKRDAINAAGGRFAAVTFIKKDGTERTMKVQPAKLKFHVKGDKASLSAQKAVATRAARNPNLLNVWNVDAQAPRSINLATVKTIAVDGMAYAYQ